MRRVAKTTRERILDSGLNLLSTSGFSGVTLGVLADRVGMSKSGLFAHFNSKEEVQTELLARTFEAAIKQVTSTAMHAPEGLPRLKAVALAWFGWFTRAGFPGGCPVAGAMFEFDDVESQIREQILGYSQQWNELLTQLVSDAISKKHLRKGLDVQQFLWELRGIYFGHHVSLRFFREPQSDTRAERAFEGLIERALPIESKRLSKRQKEKHK
jgi:AcrR family transcriptional regulator